MVGFIPLEYGACCGTMDCTAVLWSTQYTKTVLSTSGMYLGCAAVPALIAILRSMFAFWVHVILHVIYGAVTVAATVTLLKIQTIADE